MTLTNKICCLLGFGVVMPLGIATLIVYFHLELPSHIFWLTVISFGTGVIAAAVYLFFLWREAGFCPLFNKGREGTARRGG